jgi:ribonucleoside-diphosphate reductase alpha chain
MMAVIPEQRKKDIKSSVNKDNEPDVKHACLNTKFLIDEIANLKLKSTTNSITVEQQVRKVDKDRYSSLAYALYYIFMFLEKKAENTDPYEESQLVWY